MKIHFENANEAYEYYHDRILTHGISFGDTKALFNIGFYLENPRLKEITNKIINGPLLSTKTFQFHKTKK